MMKAIFFNLLFILTANYCLSQVDNNVAKNIIDSVGLKQGYWLEFEAHPTVKYIVEDLLDGGKSAHSLDYDFNNLKILKLEGHYKDGLRVGEWLIFLPNGKKKYLVTYSNGNLEGKFEMYYPENNQIELKGNIERKEFITLQRFLENGKSEGVITIPTKKVVQKIFQ